MKSLALSLLMLGALALSSGAAPRKQTAKPFEQLEGAVSRVYKKTGDVELRLHIFNPADHQPSDKRPAIVLFFGGGWNSGSPASLQRQAQHLASRGMVGICADYRVRSRHQTTPFECIADGKSAMRWVRAHAGELGIDPDRIAAGGGSAGGHVALATTLLSGLDEAGEDTKVSAAGNALVLFNPVVDTSAEKLVARFGGRWREASPLHHIRAGLPPAIIFHGTEDTTVPFESVQRFTREMEKAGNRCKLVAFPGEKHAFYHRDPSFRRIEDETGAFFVSLGWLPARD